MSSFGPILTTLNDNLILPQPARSRVLLEIAADMEAFFELARDQGRSDEEATQLALEAFHPDSESVSDLVRLHGSPVALWMDGLSSQAQSLWERLLLATAILPAVAVCLSVLTDTRVFRVAGWPAWLLTGFCVGACVLALFKLYQLVIKLDHRPRMLRRGMSLLLWLSIAPGPAGLAVFVVDLYRALGVLNQTWPDGGRELVISLLRGSAVMSLALIASILGCVLWFFLTRWIASIEEKEAMLLLDLSRKGVSDV